MRQNVWIWNHYATNMFFDKAGRHYWFAENLMMRGYNPAIFCASINHFSDNHINTKGDTISIDFVNKIPFVFVKTPNYKGNGRSRIINMISFYRNLFPTTKQYANKYGKPDIILASSVHPLTLVAGIKIAKIFNIPCICEVRDLWPESLIAYGALKRNSIITRILYQGEKWIYTKADKLIFTIEGGTDYIKDNKWDREHGGPIDINKIYHINNGIDLAEYDKNIKNNPYEDIDLDNSDIFKIVYTGSIRKANNLSLVTDAAKYVQKNGGKDIKFLIFGDGDEKEVLQKKCIDEEIDNVVFKGQVEKKFIPNILSKSNLNILNYSNHGIWKYGGSQNKNFEYLASGKPVLSTITMGYDIIEKYKAGLSLQVQSPESIGRAILSIAKIEKSKYEEMAKNARKAAEDYDFKLLTEKLIEIIEN